jgi:hypothetical protein
MTRAYWNCQTEMPSPEEKARENIDRRSPKQAGQ